MIREDFFHQTPSGIVVPGSMRFTYLAEVVAKAYEPTQSQLDALQSAYEATGNFLIECPEFEKQLVEVHAQGSRQMGTIVRPMDSSREGFDIDLVARLSPDAMYTYSGPTGAYLLLSRLRTALVRYAQRHGLAVKLWERCVTLTYAGGMQADFVPVISDPRRSVVRGEHHGLIPDRELATYLSTNPRGYCDEFEHTAKIQANFSSSFAMDSASTREAKAELAPLPDAAEVLGRLMCRFVQLAKVHRNISFADVDKDYVPTSVFITTLFGLAYKQLAHVPHDGPLELFMDMVELMPKLFERHDVGAGQQLWRLNNPFALTDNLAESMNTPERQQAFTQWHGKLRTDLQRLVRAIDGRQGTAGVIEVVKDSFGERASQAMIEHNAKGREARRAAGTARFFVGGIASAVVTPSRAHKFYGDS